MTEPEAAPLAATTTRLALPYPSGTDTVDVVRDVSALATKLDPSTAIFLQGTAGARPAAGVQGRFYWATDTKVLTYDNGTTWELASGTLEVYSGTAQPAPRDTYVLWIDSDEPPGYNPRPSVVTSLPANPVDGDECYYRFLPTTTPATTVPLVWHLRFDAANGAWLPVGDQRPILAVYSTGVSAAMGAGSWGTFDANDPRLTVPLAGTYECETGISEAYSPTPANFNVGLGKNGTVWAEASAAWSTANYGETGQIRDFNTFVSGDAVRQYYYLSGATQTITLRGRYLSIRPMRLT